MAKNFGLMLLFITAGFLVLRLVVPWFGSFSQNADALEVTYVCTETKEVIRGPAQPEPALNPKTGRKTLVRAMYATDSKQWVPAPPEQVLRKNRQQYSATDGKSPLRFAPPNEAAKSP